MTEPPLLVRHLGCGDGLMLAGGAVELAKEFGAIRFPAWHGHIATFLALFRDHPEVEIVSVKDEHDMFAKQRSMILTGTYKQARDYWRSPNSEQDWRKSEPFDKMVYREIGVPLEKKWDSFPWHWPGEIPQKRDRPYIFVHDDSARGFIMNPDRIGRSWTQSMMVAPDTSLMHPITAWTPYLLGASEIHVINSAFLWLCDLLQLPKEQRKFYHRYARPWNVCDNPTLRQNWTILD